VENLYVILQQIYLGNGLPNFSTIAQVSQELLQTSGSAIAEKLRCRLSWFWPKMEDWNGETIFWGHYIGLSLTAVT